MNTDQTENKNRIEKEIIEYIRMGKEKLQNEFGCTKEALEMIAIETTKDIVNGIDKSLPSDKEEYLINLIKISMYQSFCFGYAIGKIEKDNEIQLFL